MTMQTVDTMGPSALYYRPPVLKLAGTLFAFLTAAVVVATGAFFYGRLQPELLNLELRVGALVAACIGIGTAAAMAARTGRVRSRFLAAALSAPLSLLAIYIMWVAWIHDRLSGPDGEPILSYLQIARHPRLMLYVAVNLFDVGAWTYDDHVVRGLPLLACWLGEAGALLLAGTTLPFAIFYPPAPACSSCGHDCVSVGDLPEFATDYQEHMVAAVEQRTFEDLASHEPAQDNRNPKLTLQLLSCPRCARMHVLTLKRIDWALNSKTGYVARPTPLVDRLLIAPDQALQLLQVCKEITEQREADADANADADERSLDTGAASDTHPEDD